jgi:hypothetical protein
LTDDAGLRGYNARLKPRDPLLLFFLKAKAFRKSAKICDMRAVWRISAAKVRFNHGGLCPWWMMQIYADDGTYAIFQKV